MNRQLLLYAALMLAGTFISSLAQVLLKKAAQREYASFWQEYLNPRVIVAYVIFFGASLLAVFAYRVVPLSMGPILEATGYIYVTVFGVAIFHEKLTPQKLLALGLIVAGIVVYSLVG
jgi:multidrug transporter EmrE-like cation transporter